jgi:hypothetical protein
MKDSTLVIFKISTGLNKPNITFETNWYILGIAILFITIFYILKYFRNKNKNKNIIQNKVPKEIKIGLKDTSITYSIIRSYENIEIAHKIYIELITRKAAIPIDKEKDVIKEIYDSWYILFQITRDEAKKIPGSLLSENITKQLIEMSSTILNQGLRPHLTEYQAKFRRWYANSLEKEENKGKSPQEIQKEYPEYESLIKSMLEVNQILIDYSKQLEKFIYNQ